MGPSLKGRALRLLSNREHSKLELAKKLKQYAQTEDELLQVLEWLQAKGFINEDRVLESIVYRRAPKLGYARVARELQDKGLAPQAVAIAVKELRQTEGVRAKAVWLKKFKTPASTASEKAKQMRFLMTRGFAPSVVIQVLNETTSQQANRTSISSEDDEDFASQASECDE